MKIFNLLLVLTSLMGSRAIAGDCVEDSVMSSGCRSSSAATQAATATEGATKGSESPCAPQEQKATSTCMIIDPAMKSQLDGAISQASSMMQQGGTEKVCKAAKLVQTLAAGANGAHAVMCETAVSSCRLACKNAIVDRQAAAKAGDAKAEAEIKQATKSLNTCREMETRAIASGIAAFQNIMQTAMSAKCQSATAAATPNPNGTPPGLMDCSNPMMSNMPQCVCPNNPADPMCSGSNAGIDTGGFSSGAPGTGAVDGGVKDPTLEGFGTDDEIGHLEASNNGAPNLGGGSGGGGGMNGGSGAQPLPPEESGGPGQGPYNTDVMGGLTGGGGGSSGSYTGGGGSGDSGGSSLFGSLAEKFNLKGFLPKSDFKNRGLASGNGADGITGPNGPSLFEKISARYHKKQAELLP